LFFNFSPRVEAAGEKLGISLPFVARSDANKSPRVVTVDVLGSIILVDVHFFECFLSVGSGWRIFTFLFVDGFVVWSMILTMDFVSVDSLGESGRRESCADGQWAA
jgi:hypothetical protein